MLVDMKDVRTRTRSIIGEMTVLTKGGTLSSSIHNQSCLLTCSLGEREGRNSKDLMKCNCVMMYGGGSRTVNLVPQEQIELRSSCLPH